MIRISAASRTGGSPRIATVSVANPWMPGLQQRGQGRALLEDACNLAISAIAVLTEDSTAKPDVAAPVLGVHD